MFEDVYKEMPWHLREQQDEMVRFRARTRRRGRVMATMNMAQALNSAMDVMLQRDPDVLVFGEDVGFFGGVFRVTEGCSSATATPASSMRRSPRAA